MKKWYYSREKFDGEGQTSFGPQGELPEKSDPRRCGDNIPSITERFCPTTGCETPPSRQNNKLSNYAADRPCDSASGGVRFRFLGSLRRVTQGFVFGSHVELKV